MTPGERALVIVALTGLSIVAVVAGYESGNRHGYALGAVYFLLMLWLGYRWTKAC